MLLFGAFGEGNNGKNVKLKTLYVGCKKTPTLGFKECWMWKKDVPFLVLQTLEALYVGQCDFSKVGDDEQYIYL
jgi:hypothetical protein